MVRKSLESRDDPKLGSQTIFSMQNSQIMTKCIFNIVYIHRFASVAFFNMHSFFKK